MKKIILIIIISSISTFAQKEKSKNEINFSGEYIGEFSDLKNIKGTIELFLYESKNGFSDGIILMKKMIQKLYLEQSELMEMGNLYREISLLLKLKILTGILKRQQICFLKIHMNVDGIYTENLKIKMEI